MSDGIRLIRHTRMALRLRRQLDDLRDLLDGNSFWAQGRSLNDLSRMLSGSQAVVSAWDKDVLVGFGRASSDGVFRAVLWDLVVATDHQGQGIGRRLVEGLLSCPSVAKAERVYLMTTNSGGFYRRLGFETSEGQELLVRRTLDII